ncbi:MAG: thermonuclease family protein [Ilumatobacteraceae bacterium]
MVGRGRASIHPSLLWANLFLIGSVVLHGCTTEHTGTPAKVVAIIDGDTLEIAIRGHTVTTRLIGIDTPETKKPGSPVECHGPEATEFLRQLVPPGTAVVLQRDVEGRDHYDRLLAYVFRIADGLFVNREIIRRGFARPLSIPPNTTYAREFASQAAHARQERLGLWQCASVTS